MTQHDEPDAELLLSKQRGILPPHERDGEKPGNDEVLKEEFERGEIDRDDPERNETG